MTRREMLAGAAGLGGTLALPAMLNAAEPHMPKIQRVETFAVHYPTTGRFKFFEDLQGRPIGRPTVVIRIAADNGAVGWGQSVPSNRWSYETPETVQTTIDRYLGPLLIAKDASDLAGIHAEMNKWIAPSFSTGQPICKAGIDLALHDLSARLRSESAAKAWNRKGRDRVRLSWTLNPRTLNELEGMIEEGKRHGYNTFNVKVAPDLKFDIEMCRIVKRLAPDGFLWADANGGYDEATALEAAPRLADIGVAVLEQPVPANRITSFQKLRRQGALPIILDEGVVSSSDLEEFIKLEMCNGVAIKPARCGALTDARRQIELCEKHGLMWLGSGLTDPDIALAASLLLYGTYDLKYPAALNGPQYLAGTSILRAPFAAADGHLAVPTGPGLGIEVDEPKLRELATAKS